MTSFYSNQELNEIGFKNIGKNISLSKKASIYSPERISIGNNVRIDDFSILSGNITIGDYVHIAAFCALFAGENGIVMHDFAGISSRVTIYATSDDYSGLSLTNPTIPSEFRNVYGGEVALKKHTIIGSSTVILPNVIIEEGAAVGSCSLVLKNCDSWSIYAGIPVKKIKDRNKNLLELEKILLNS